MTIQKCLLALALSSSLVHAQDKAPKKEIIIKATALKSGFKGMILQAVKSHPQIKKLQSASQITFHDIDIAKGAFLPTFDIRSSNGYEHSSNATVVNDGDLHRTRFRRENSFIARQLLFDGGEASTRVERNKYLYSRANFGTLDGKEALALRAVIAYLDVFRVREQLTLSVGNIKAHNEILKIVEARLKHKIDRASDKVQVSGRLALAEAQLRRDKADLNSAEARFIEVFGVKPGVAMAAAAAATGIPKELQQAQNVTAVSHPALEALKETVKSIESSIKEVKSRYLPRINLEVSGAFNEDLGGNNSMKQNVILFATSPRRGMNATVNKLRLISSESIKLPLEKLIKPINSSMNSVREVFLTYSMLGVNTSERAFPWSMPSTL